MISSSPPDILGHFDLIKKNNKGLFDEEAPWYREAVHETVEALAASSVMVEVNTGGVTRGFREDFYPSLWIVELMRSKGVRITVNSELQPVGSVVMPEMWPVLEFSINPAGRLPSMMPQ